MTPLRSNPIPPTCSTTWARCWECSLAWRRRRHYLGRAIAAEPTLARAHANLAARADGAEAAGRGRGGRAARLELKPDYASAHNNLGTILEEAGRPCDAETCFREVLRRVPDHREALKNLADVLVVQGRAPKHWNCSSGR